MKDEHKRINELLRRGNASSAFASVHRRTVETPTEQSPEAKAMNAFIRREPSEAAAGATAEDSDG